MDNNNEVPNADIEQSLAQYKEVMFREYVVLEDLIDNLPKQALIRLTKLYTGCNLAREIAEVGLLDFHQDEEKLIKKSMKLQDDCIGYLQLKKEINEKKQGESNGN